MPVLTLSTDIGQSDYLVGAIKGQLTTFVPSFTIIDITHHLSDNYQQAAYICKNAFKHFPSDTFHLIIINFFDKAPKHVLMANHEQQYIICPDNGILTMIAGNKPEHIFSIDMPDTNNTLLNCTKAIVQALKRVNEGEVLKKLINTTDNITEKYPMRSTSGPDWIESQIIFIDRFENVVVNLTKEEFEEIRQNRKFRISLMREREFIQIISCHYASVHAGEKLAWFNSAGYLEIAINQGNVAGLFGLQGFKENKSAMQNRLLYQTIRIQFEE